MMEIVEGYLVYVSDNYKFKFFDVNINHDLLEIDNSWSTWIYNNRYYIIGGVVLSTLGLLTYYNYEIINAYFFPHEQVPRTRVITYVAYENTSDAQFAKSCVDCFGYNNNNNNCYKIFNSNYDKFSYGYCRTNMFNHAFVRWVNENPVFALRYEAYVVGNEFAIYFKNSGHVVPVDTFNQLCFTYVRQFFVNGYVKFVLFRL